MQFVFSLLVALPALALSPLAQMEGQRSTRHADSGSPSLPGPSEALEGQLAAPGFLQGVGSAVLDDGPALVGPAYRALFDPERVLFHPALGEICPTTQHLEFRLESIELGGEALVGGGPVEPTLDDLVVTYARGSVLERYEARLDGLEQTFVFTEPLPAIGDLVVRGRLATSLPLGDTRRTDGGLDFVHPTYGGITLGGVTGISADGKTAAGELRFDGEFVEYVLPRSFLEAATYPLVLDPLIGTEMTLSTGAGLGSQNPDIAHSHFVTTFVVPDTYLAVWGTTYALGDIDVRARQLDEDGMPFGNELVVRLTVGLVSGIPAVASLRQSGKFVIAWSEGSLLGSRDVLAASFDPLTTTMSAAAVVAGGSSNQTEPDVGGDNYGAAIGAVVTWRDGDGGVWAAHVTPQFMTLAPAVSGTVEIMSGTGYRNPSINDKGGAPMNWLIAAERFFSTPAPGDYDIEWVVVDSTLGAVAGPNGFGSIGANEERPAVDGNGSQFILAWQTDEPGNWDVRFRSVESSGVLGPVRDVLTGNSLDQTRPAVLYTDYKYLIVHEYDSATGGNLQLSELCNAGLALCAPASALLPSTTARQTPAMASMWSGSSVNIADDGFLLWRQGTSTLSIAGRPVDGTVGGSVTNLGGGCGDTVNIVLPRPPSLGNTGFHFRLNIPGGATYAFGNARLNASVPYSCGSCLLQVAPGIMLYPSALGATSITLPAAIPGDPLLDGVQVTTQFFVLGTASSPCPLFANASATDRIQFEIRN